MRRRDFLRAGCLLSLGSSAIFADEEPAEQGHEHADRHDDETRQNRRAPADAIRKSSEQQRAETHADELHRQDDSQGRRCNAPVRGNAGRGETDRENVEAIERVEAKRHRDDMSLQPCHRRRVNDFPWVRRVGHRETTYT